MGAPVNMGAWSFIRDYLPENTQLIARDASSVTATGSHQQHKKQLDNLLNEAFS
jgi:2-oxoglutarate dehydrogenase complex dehydrogenase (E1) component-like enzyme